jgi:hypothetical protein
MDTDTFLTALYVRVDDYFKAHGFHRLPGPPACLSVSEIVTLALFEQFHRFESESAFYRFAAGHLRDAFPGLPDRTRYNRLVRERHDDIVSFALSLATDLSTKDDAYEALDGTAVPVRNIRRRGYGWLHGQADIGLGHRIGWYEGFYVLLSVRPTGVVTGFGFAPASHKDQTVAETFFSVRHCPHPRLLSVGQGNELPYLVDKGFEGKANHQRWRSKYNVTVICPPKSQCRVKWSQKLHLWAANLRQIVETVVGKLQATFGLGQDRPHDMSGFRVRLAAKIAIHNFSIWINTQQGRPNLAFADLIT